MILCMLSVVKRIKLLLAFILLFGVEENYCSDNSVQNDQNPNSQAQEVKGSSPIQAYIGYEIFGNIVYWLFGLYQKQPGWYWYKYYCSFGYRTCLFSNSFYFDFYMRTWVGLLAVPSVLKLLSLGRMNSNIMKGLLCFILVPAVDLNICLGDNFYLGIGFRDIILTYFFNNVQILQEFFPEEQENIQQQQNNINSQNPYSHNAEY